MSAAATIPSAVEPRSRGLRERLRALADIDGTELSLVATCVLLSHDRTVGHFIPILGIAGLVYPPLRRAAGFWLLVTTALAWSNYRSWWIVDNHKYLINYWTLAIGLSWLTSNPVRNIARNARVLIGLAFLLSVVQKAVSGDFLDGTFFHLLLVQGQPRFRLISQLLTGLDPAVIETNYRTVHEMLRSYDSTITLVQLQASPRVHLIAAAMTWWTQGIEVLVAAAFLWPGDRGLAKWRDLLLVAFLLTTYVVAQVLLFGWVLAAMGVSQCDSRFSWLRLAYVLAFLAIVLYAVPLEALPWLQ